MKFAKVLFTFSFSIFLFLGLLPCALSQKTAPGSMTVTYGIDEDANTRVPPPSIQRVPTRVRTAKSFHPQFAVTYTDFTSEARAAFQYAVNIWDAFIRSPVTIRIDAVFVNLGGGYAALAIGGPDHRVIPTGYDAWMVAALGDALEGYDVVPSDPDILVFINSNNAVGWYYSTDGNTPSGQYDFVTVALHEIGHGLGFMSSARISIDTNGFKEGRLRPTDDPNPYIYDTFVVNRSGTVITSYDDPSNALFLQLIGNGLYWNGKNGKAANDGTRPRLYAPNKWVLGTSFVHLNETTFYNGDQNSLMTAFISQAEAIHHPGPIALGMLEDMGWTINKPPVFTAATTTRAIAENTGVGVNIGSPVQATDANNDTLTYTLSGTDASSFSIGSTTGQLKTESPLNYEIKNTYTVIVNATDTDGLTDTISVTVNVTDVNEAPVFTAGNTTTREMAVNTPANRDIGIPVSATDEDTGDTLTYTLSGTDAASFSIGSTTGQLKTNTHFNIVDKNTYVVIVTATDSTNLTDTIRVAINITGAVVFADSVLKAAVRRQLGIPSDTPIVPSALSLLTGLTASADGITSLTGLEYATNLERLDLGDNEITDMSPLRNLTLLKTLDLADNEIVDVSPLRNLTNLTDLDLDDNQIENISALSGLVDLETLDLRNNDVMDVTPLSAMTNLRYLYLSGNANLSNLKHLVKLKNAGTRVDITLPNPVNIPDDNLEDALQTALGLQTDDPIFPEDMETLTRFSALNQDIVNLTGLEAATNLTSLTLSNNQIVSLSPLSRLTSLESLNLSTNQITSVSSLSNLTGLTDLNLSNNRISSVSSLSRLTNLESLDLSKNQIISISSLSTLSSLTTLDLSDNRITNVLSLQGLSNLTTLDLTGNAGITNAAVLYKLEQGGTTIFLPSGITLPTNVVTFNNAALEAAVRSRLGISTGYPILLTGEKGIDKLTSLTATYKQIDDLTGLEGASVLTTLDLGNNSIVTLSPLRNLSNLETLDLADNEIKDLGPLSGLSGLTSLDLDDNKIQDVSALSGLSRLQTLDLRGNDVMDVAPLKDLTSLRNIYLSGNENITNLEWLGALENLRSDIRLPDVVRIPDTSLDGAIRTALRIAGNTVSNDLPMSEELLESLETLTASNRGISDLTGCEHMTGLTSLDLRNNRITDATPLSKLYSLETLQLDGNPILDTSVLRELERRGTSIDITIYRYPFWDVNQDGDVDEADLFLVTLTITGESPDVNGDGSVDADDRTAADANKDGRVDTGDLLLIFQKQDRPVNLAAPLLSAGLDWELLERIDVGRLRTELDIIRSTSDGTPQHQQAIAFLQAILVAIQPNQTLLLPNYPNPFNPETWIPYQLARGSDVRITIYDGRGVVIRRLELGYRAEGYYRIRSRAAYWDGRNDIGERVASGIYFYQLETDNVSLLRKMVILK